MRNRLWVIVIAFVFGVSSCNLPTPQTTKTPASTPLLDTPTSSMSPAPTRIATRLDIELPTITPTSTPRVFLAAPKEQPVNCRFGPGISYAVIVA